jgi:TRAP-type C4-dicarboxylate transport system permease small subunit
MQRFASQLISVIVVASRVIVGLAIFAAIAVNFLNVVGRYLFNAPIVWAEEVMTYLMVWSVFVGAVLVTWEGRHIRMDLISHNLHWPFKKIVHTAAALTFIAVCAFTAVQAWLVTGLMVKFEYRSVAADIPMAIPHAALLFGSTGMLVAVVVRFRLYATDAFGSEQEATADQLKQSFGTFDVAEDAPAQKP